MSLAILFICFGIINFIFVPLIIKNVVSNSLVLINSSKAFDSWKTLPIPIINSFYFFNVSNSIEVKNGQLPVLAEVGPYVFRQEIHKVNISWNEDESLVEYDVLRRWFFDPERSQEKSMSDQIYHLNVPLVSSADFVTKLKMASREKLFLYYAINELHSQTNSSLFSMHSIHDLMFKGYSDSLIDEAFMLNFDGMSIPFDKFGWFYGKNDTSSSGRFSVYSGKKDIRKIGQLHSWKGSTQLSDFQESCKSLSQRPVVTDFFAPFSQDTPESFQLFVGDICRPLTLNFQGEKKYRGLTTRRYAIDKRSLDNSLPDNKCFCPEEKGCPTNGIIDTSKCTFDAPSLVSLPHFLFGDISLKRGFNGISPDFNRHSFSIDVHPVLGIPVSAQIALQINIRLTRDKKIHQLRNMTDNEIVFPVFWFKAVVDLPKEMMTNIMIFDQLPKYINLIGIVLIVTGITIIISTAILYQEDFLLALFNWRNRRRMKSLNKYRLKAVKENQDGTGVSLNRPSSSF